MILILTTVEIVPVSKFVTDFTIAKDLKVVVVATFVLFFKVFHSCQNVYSFDQLHTVTIVSYGISVVFL